MVLLDELGQLNSFVLNVERWRWVDVETRRHRSFETDGSNETISRGTLGEYWVEDGG